MEKVRIEDLKPGMVLGRTIYGTDGRILVKENAEISASIIEKLRKLGLPAAYIRQTDDSDRPDLVSDATRMDLIRSLSKIDTEVRAGGDPNLGSSKIPLYDLVDEIVRNQRILLGMTDIWLHNDYTYGHSVHVAIIAVKIGLQMGYNQLKLADLAVGALFHDIGMTKIPLAILEKTDNLTEEEMKLIQTHAEVGYNMLRQSQDISNVAAHVAYQHHERYNGSGYPRGMAGDAIHEFARIVAIADVYDSMTTEKIYRPAKPMMEAMHYVDTRKGIDFDPNIVDIFEQVVAV